MPARILDFLDTDVRAAQGQFRCSVAVTEDMNFVAILSFIKFVIDPVESDNVLVQEHGHIEKGDSIVGSKAVFSVQGEYQIFSLGQPACDLAVMKAETLSELSGDILQAHHVFVVFQDLHAFPVVADRKVSDQVVNFVAAKAQGENAGICDLRVDFGRKIFFSGVQTCLVDLSKKLFGFFCRKSRTFVEAFDQLLDKFLFSEEVQQIRFLIETVFSEKIARVVIIFFSLVLDKLLFLILIKRCEKFIVLVGRFIKDCQIKVKISQIRFPIPFFGQIFHKHLSVFFYSIAVPAGPYQSTLLSVT